MYDLNLYEVWDKLDTLYESSSVTTDQYTLVDSDNHANLIDKPKQAWIKYIKNESIDDATKLELKNQLINIKATWQPLDSTTIRSDEATRQSGIYAIVNVVTNQLYIGQAAVLADRLLAHFNAYRNDSPFLHAAIRENGTYSFNYTILETYTNSFSSEEEAVKLGIRLNESEKKYIKKYNTFNLPYDYNLTGGGKGSYSVVKITPEQVEAILSAANQNKYATEIHRKTSIDQKTIKAVIQSISTFGESSKYLKNISTNQDLIKSAVNKFYSDETEANADAAVSASKSSIALLYQVPNEQIKNKLKDINTLKKDGNKNPNITDLDNVLTDLDIIPNGILVGVSTTLKRVAINYLDLLRPTKAIEAQVDDTNSKYYIVYVSAKKLRSEDTHTASLICYPIKLLKAALDVIEDDSLKILPQDTLQKRKTAKLILQQALENN